MFSCICFGFGCEYELLRVFVRRKKLTEDIKKRLKKIGSLSYIAKRLGYSYGYVKNVNNRPEPPSEMFEIKLKQLEDQKDE